ncbi:MAG: hypothetical protein ACM3PP_06890 [Candidatus Saccharibacteria bacterium]
MRTLVCPNCGEEYTFSLVKIVKVDREECYPCETCGTVLRLNWFWDLAPFLALVVLVALIVNFDPYLDYLIHYTYPLIGFIAFVALFVIFYIVLKLLFLLVMPLRFEDEEKRKIGFDSRLLNCPNCGKPQRVRVVKMDELSYKSPCPGCNTKLEDNNVFTVSRLVILITVFIGLFLLELFINDYLKIPNPSSLNSFSVGFTVAAIILISRFLVRTSLYWLPIKLVSIQGEDAVDREQEVAEAKSYMSDLWSRISKRFKGYR